MRQTMRPRGLSISGAILVGLVAVFAAGGCASAQTAGAGQGSAVQGYLVRQDFSDCTNRDVSKVYSPLVGGSIWVTRMPDGTTGVKVALTVTPNTTYHFFLKCVRLLGDITTDGEGIANVSFVFPTNSVGAVFAFDMYPEGAPLGNKYQSTQIAFP